MKVRQNDTLMALRRVQGFLDTNAAALGTVNSSGARADLDAAVTQLTAFALAQKTSSVQSQGATSNQTTLRAALLDAYMAPIAAIAKAKLATVPELSSMTMPSRKVHSQALITAAGAMANAASPYSATFIGQGLPTDFVAQLQAAAAALQASIDGRSAIKNVGVGATEGAKTEVQAARKVIGVLNTMVAPQLVNNLPLLAQWKNAKRVTSKPGVAIGSTQTTPPVTPTPAAPAPITSATTAPAVTTAAHGTQEVKTA